MVILIRYENSSGSTCSKIGLRRSLLSVPRNRNDERRATLRTVHGLYLTAVQRNDLLSLAYFRANVFRIGFRRG